MIDVPIELGDCDCHHWYRLPHLCWKDKKIYLVAEKQHCQIIIDRIEACFNHETIHLVIDKLEGERTARSFDRVFSMAKKVVTRGDGTP